MLKHVYNGQLFENTTGVPKRVITDLDIGNVTSGPTASATPNVNDGSITIDLIAQIGDNGQSGYVGETGPMGGRVLQADRSVHYRYRQNPVRYAEERQKYPV